MQKLKFEGEILEKDRDFTHPFICAVRRGRDTDRETREREREEREGGREAGTVKISIATFVLHTRNFQIKQTLMSFPVFYCRSSGFIFFFLFQRLN